MALVIAVIILLPMLMAESDPITWSLVDENDDDAFTIGSEDGVLGFPTAPDSEAPTDADGNNIYHVTVRAEVSQQASAVYGVTMRVINVLEAGTVTLLSSSP